MFTKKEIESLNQEIIEVVSKDSSVNVFCLHGSRSVGRHTKDSDLDYYVLFNGNGKTFIPRFVKKVSKKTALDLVKYHLHLRKLIGFYGSHFSLDGKKVSIHFLETKDLKANLLRLFASEEDFSKQQGFARGWVEEAKVLYDPKKIFVDFKKKVKFDVKFRKEQIEKKSAIFKNLLPYMKNAAEKDYFVYYDYLRIMLKFLIDLYYLKNKGYQISHFKGLKADLKNFKPKIGKELQYLMEKPNCGIYRKNKVKVIEKVFRKL